MGNYCSYVSSIRHTTNNNNIANRSKDDITKYDNSVRNTLNPKKDTRNNEMVGNALILKENETMVLGADDHQLENEGEPKVVLFPHQHTLFCERKQRVCTAVGRCQELEVLKLAGNISDFHWTWFRTQSNKLPKDHVDTNQVTIVAGSENKLDYTLGIDDVGYFIGVLYEPKEGKKAFRPDRSSIRAENLIGPILPGPPRLLDFEISGDLFVGGYAKAEGKYIGGFEGPSEYWWMKVTADGKRSQITEPKAIPFTSTPNSNRSASPSRKSNLIDVTNDPRYYKITPDDIGCTLKSKCRPIRNDKVAGEIFTSKSSDIIAKGRPKVAK